MTERAALTLPLALLAGGAAHFALRRGARLLARALSRRGGAPPVGPVTTPASLAFAVVLLQTFAWLAAAWLATQQLPALREARDALASIAAESFAAPLFTQGGRSYSARDLSVLAALVFAIWLGAAGLSRLFRSQVLEAAGVEAGAQETLATLLRHALTLVGSVVLLQSWGVDLRSFAILASVLGVGIGFGLQNIANNFVSGVLILAERPVRPGDFVRVGGFEGSVTRVGARSTAILTQDRVTVLVPNSRLLEEEVFNWSHGQGASRVHVPVGVAYGSDVRRVRHLLLEAARVQRGVLRDPRPEVELLRLGESSLDFELLVWTADPRHASRLLSELNFRIVAALRAARVEIPFPQRDLHLRSLSLERALAAWTRRNLPEALEEAAPPPVAPPKDERAAGDFSELGPEEWSDAEVAAVAERMRGPLGVPIADRRHLLSVYPRCFVGAEAVDWLVERIGVTRSEAVEVGGRLVELGRIRHVLSEHGFRDGHYFFRFREDEAEDAARDARYARAPERTQRR
jgi:small-conductance mechanosensitive channel